MSLTPRYSKKLAMARASLNRGIKRLPTHKAGKLAMPQVHISKPNVNSYYKAGRAHVHKYKLSVYSTNWSVPKFFCETCGKEKEGMVKFHRRY
jgi:hypothetical protein